MEKIEVIDALSALAQETRLDMFRLLVQVGHSYRAFAPDLTPLPTLVDGDTLFLPAERVPTDR